MQITKLLSGLWFASLALSAPGSYGYGNGGGNAKCPAAQSSYLKKVKQRFKQDRIVPDLIEAINPKVKLDVSYGTKKVDLGTYFTTVQTLNAPTISFSAESNYKASKTKYTVFLVDPDVPENGSPVQVNFLHWMVSDLQPDCIPNQTPNTVVIYEPLTPLSTTQHRYTFLVYRQPASFDSTDVGQDALLQTRTPFDLNDFVDDKGLILVGGNFLKEAISNGLQG